VEFNYAYNEDTGDINDIHSVDSFVIGMSKCGTTTMQHSLRSPVIKYHSDFTLERVFGTKELSTKLLLEERWKIDRPFYVYVPYRNPVERKISQYYHYLNSADKSNDLRIEQIRNFCLGDYSLFSKGSRTEVDEDMVFDNILDSTGIDVLSVPFNSFGTVHLEIGNLNLIYYILDKIVDTGKYIKSHIDSDFTLETKRVTGDVNGLSFVKENIKFTDEELDIVYGSKYCKHFYTEFEIDLFKERYRYG